MEIPTGANFQPSRILWDDASTPYDNSDDIAWALDQSHGSIAGYHVHFNGSSFSASNYTLIDTRAFGNCKFPVAFTKSRNYGSPPAQGLSYCSSDLYVFDADSRDFVIYTVPYVSGYVVPGDFGVSFRRVHCPVPDVIFSALTTDAWGNILAVDASGGGIYKFDKDFNLLDTYGGRGRGPLGTEQMWKPVGIAIMRRNLPGTATEMTNQAMLTEAWEDSTGVQGLRLGITARDVVASVRSGVDSIDVSYFTTDHGRSTVEILNASGSPVRTMLNNVVERSGLHTLVWNGRDDAGSTVAKCATYTAKVQAVSLYASPETSIVQTTFYYKPIRQGTLTINSNVPGTRLTFDGRDSTLAGNTFAVACSLCTTHTMEVPPTQVISGTRYCFESWTGGLNRFTSIGIQDDRTVQLALTRGSPPGTFAASATLPVELYECSSPYVLLGDTYTSTFGLTIYPNTTLRFKPASSGALTQFKVRGPLTATGVRFETTDSTSTLSPSKWSGLVADTVNVSSGGGNVSIALTNCTITNADVGIQSYSQRTLRTLTIDGCTFSSNLRDIRARFLPISSSVLRLNGSKFKASSPIDIYGSAWNEPTVACTVTNDTLTGPPVGTMVALRGGMSGTISRNYFRGAERSTATLVLDNYLDPSGPFPVVTLRDNKFNCTAPSSRTALSAPYAPLGTYINMDAYYNDWGVYDAASIEGLIWHFPDERGDATHPGRVEVLYNPFTVPSGGGGGGGCPFVLSRSDTGFVVENTLLGTSQLTPNAGDLVDDAYPLERTERGDDGHVVLRIAELESETDRFDYVGLAAVSLEEGTGLGVMPNGRVVSYRPLPETMNAVKWTGRTEPYASPVAPALAYRGQCGDSLEFTCAAGTIATTHPWRRGIGIHLIPKPQQILRPGIPIGISLRVSAEIEGDRWITMGPLIPREHWSTLILPLEGDAVKRVRVVWHSTHVLGSIFLVDLQELGDLASLPIVAAQHSGGRSVAAEIGQRDGKTMTLMPGEHTDFEFDATGAPQGARYVLLARGRYELGRSERIPEAYSATRSRPNPFNPETSFELGLPRATSVTVRIYDVSGHLVRTLLKGTLPAGTHVLRWDGTDERRRPLASGVYFYQIHAGEFSRRDRVVLVR